MDELQQENLQQKQEIKELRCGSSGLALELKSSQDNMLQLEQQLQQKEELVCVMALLQSWLHATINDVIEHLSTACS